MYSGCKYKSPPRSLGYSWVCPKVWETTAGEAEKRTVRRDAANRILGTFPIVKKKVLESFDNFRTKDTIRSIYDHLTAAF
jgi:hypothetical protein